MSCCSSICLNVMVWLGLGFALANKLDRNFFQTLFYVMEFLTMESKKKIGTVFFSRRISVCQLCKATTRRAVDLGYTRKKNVWLSYFFGSGRSARARFQIYCSFNSENFFSADVIADANTDTATATTAIVIIIIAVAIVAIVNISLCKPIFHRIDFRRFSMCTQNLDYSLHKPIIKWITFNVFALLNWKTKSHFSFCSPIQYQNDKNKHGEAKVYYEAHRKAKHLASIPEWCI